MATVCQTCGDQGVVEALIYCDSCDTNAMHRYCLDITPVPFEDYITWFCAACNESDSGSDGEKVDQTAKIRHVLKKKKKKTKKRKRKEKDNHVLDEMKQKSSNLSLEVLGRFEDHGIQDSTNVAPAKVVCIGSESGSNREEVDQTAKLIHVLRKKKKKTKKRKRKQNVNPGLDEMNKKSSNFSSEVLGRYEDHGLQDGTNVEPAKASSLPIQERVNESERLENSESRKPHKLTGLDRNGALVLEVSNSSTVPDHDSCTSRKRILSSGNCDEETDSFKPRTPFGASEDYPNKLPRTCENRQLVVWKSSCVDVVSSKPQTSEELTDWHFDSQAANQYRAQPVIQPIWRGSLSVKQGSIHSIDGLVAHLSSLACPKVFEVASSLHNRLSAEMFPRLDIWPRSFLQNGGPSDESIALYFFPSKSNEKVFDSLVLELKNNDLAMRAMLDNAELLLFTSNTLPVHSWSFQSKYYLWGVFRAKQYSRH